CSLRSSRFRRCIGWRRHFAPRRTVFPRIEDDDSARSLTKTLDDRGGRADRRDVGRLFGGPEFPPPRCAGGRQLHAAVFDRDDSVGRRRRRRGTTSRSRAGHSRRLVDPTAVTRVEHAGRASPQGQSHPCGGGAGAAPGERARRRAARSFLSDRPGELLTELPTDIVHVGAAVEHESADLQPLYRPSERWLHAGRVRRQPAAGRVSARTGRGSALPAGRDVRDVDVERGGGGRAGGLAAGAAGGDPRNHLHQHRVPGTCAAPVPVRSRGRARGGGAGNRARPGGADVAGAAKAAGAEPQPPDGPGGWSGQRRSRGAVRPRVVAAADGPARQRAAEAAFEQAAAQYRSTVITSFQNVADVLYALQADAESLRAAVAAERAAKRTLDITLRQQEFGAASYLALLSARQAYQQALITRVQAQANRLADTAALFQALGGGWWNRPSAARTTGQAAER